MQYGDHDKSRVAVRGSLRSSEPIFTLNRERVPLAFQAGHAGSIPVTHSTEKPLHSKVFARPRSLLLKRGPCVPSGAVRATQPCRGEPGKLARDRVQDNPPEGGALRSTGSPTHARRRRPR